MQSNVGDPQELVVTVSFALQKHTNDHWVRTWQRSELFLVERVSKEREERIRDASGVVGLYVWSWKNRLKCIEQLVQDPTRNRDVQTEKPVAGSRGADGSNSAPTSSGDAKNDAGTGPSSG